MNNTLHVAACYFNPNQSKTLEVLKNRFIDHMKKTEGVALCMIEIRYKTKEEISKYRSKYLGFPLEFSAGDGVFTKYVCSSSVLFHKENLLNIAIKELFPSDWEFGAIIDADLQFNRIRWASDAVSRLQGYPFVQLFDKYIQVPNIGKRIEERTSFACNHEWKGHGTYCWDIETGVEYKNPHCPCGAAWGFRRDAYEAIGGFYDKAIVGSGDRIFAEGLVNNINQDLAKTYTQDFSNSVTSYQRKVFEWTRGNFSYVPGDIIHFWHGPKKERQYFKKNLILIEHKYEPSNDLIYNHQGVLEFAGNKPKFEEDIRTYFTNRNEDIPYVVR